MSSEDYFDFSPLEIVESPPTVLSNDSAVPSGMVPSTLHGQHPQDVLMAYHHVQGSPPMPQHVPMSSLFHNSFPLTPTGAIPHQTSNHSYFSHQVEPQHASGSFHASTPVNSGSLPANNGWTNRAAPQAIFAAPTPVGFTESTLVQTQIGRIKPTAPTTPGASPTPGAGLRKVIQQMVDGIWRSKVQQDFKAHEARVLSTVERAVSDALSVLTGRVQALELEREKQGDKEKEMEKEKELMLEQKLCKLEHKIREAEARLDIRLNRHNMIMTEWQELLSGEDVRQT